MCSFFKDLLISAMCWGTALSPGEMVMSMADIVLFLSELTLEKIDKVYLQ